MKERKKKERRKKEERKKEERKKKNERKKKEGTKTVRSDLPLVKLLVDQLVRLPTPKISLSYSQSPPFRLVLRQVNPDHLIKPNSVQVSY